jgi:hypothetical protein
MADHWLSYNTVLEPIAGAAPPRSKSSDSRHYQPKDLELIYEMCKLDV